MGKFVKLQAFRWLEENCRNAFIALDCVAEEVYVRAVNVAVVEKRILRYADFFSEEEMDKKKSWELLDFTVYIEGYWVRLVTGAEYFAPKSLNDMKWLKEA